MVLYSATLLSKGVFNKSVKRAFNNTIRYHTIIMSTANSSSNIKLPTLPPLPISINDIRSTHEFTPNAHWVIPNILMQGGRPGFGISDDDKMQEQVRKIVKDGGCRTFVCAQAECLPEEGSILLDNGSGGCRKSEPKDLPSYANHVVSAVKEVEEHEGGSGDVGKPKFLYFGIIGDKPAKSIDSLSNAVNDIVKRIQGGETVYIHCGGGVGRAGLLTACVLGELYNDLDAKSALEYTTSFCQLRNMEGGIEKHYSSPETDEQKDQVRDYFEKIRSVE